MRERAPGTWAWGLGYGSLAVSSDEQTILYSRLVTHGVDLMLLDNFR